MGEDNTLFTPLRNKIPPSIYSITPMNGKRATKIDVFFDMKW